MQGILLGRQAVGKEAMNDRRQERPLVGTMDHVRTLQRHVCAVTEPRSEA